MKDELGDLTATQLLAAAERNVIDRRRAEVDQLLVALEWCDRNGEDPQSRPGAVPAGKGGDKLVQIGGDGTPLVAELSLGELAIAFGVGAVATHNLIAAGLDLRHRFPLLWSEVRRLRLPVWVARRITTLARPLTLDACEIVDTAVAATAEQSPSRILSIAEAKIIEADLDAHRERIRLDADRTGCWLSKPRTGEIIDPYAPDGPAPATRRITAKLPAGDAIELDNLIDELADALKAQLDLVEGQESPTHAQLRAQAVSLLSHPHAAADLLDGQTQPRPPVRRKAVLHVHLSALALAGVLPGVSRVEGLGPFLLEQLRDLLGRRDLTVQPVLDLAGVTTVNGYEHPTVVRERAIQRMGGDVYPHSTNQAGVGGQYDLDHATPYDASGPPGQTSDRNAAPLTRRHHRYKTHRGYQVTQIGLNAYRWVTPHGLARVVTPRGTTHVTLARAPDGTILGEYYPDPPGLTISLHPQAFDQTYLNATDRE